MEFEQIVEQLTSAGLPLQSDEAMLCVHFPGCAPIVLAWWGEEELVFFRLAQALPTGAIVTDKIPLSKLGPEDVDQTIKILRRIREGH